MSKEVIITCKRGCAGTKDLCIPEIIETTEKGNTAFIIYGGHVKEILEKIGGFEFLITYQDSVQGKIPIGLRIRKKA